MNRPSQKAEQDFVIYVVEESFNIEFDDPFIAVSANEKADSLNGVVCAAKWSEPVTVRVLLPFVDGFQDAADNILGNAVDDSGDTERALFRGLVKLPDKYSSYRAGHVRTEYMFDFFPKLLPSFLRCVILLRHVIYAGCVRTCVTEDVLNRLVNPDIPSQQIMQS